MKREKSIQLLNAIVRVQARHIADGDHRQMFDGFLQDLLDLTESEYGLIGEVMQGDDAAPYLQCHAVSNIAWNTETLQRYERYRDEGLQFRNLDTLYGAVLKTGLPVIANEPKSDPRRGGLPAGHPRLDAFLGLPFYYGDVLLGMVGLANREQGYDQELVDYLQPFLDSCGLLIHAERVQRLRKEAEQELEDYRSNLERLVAERTINITLALKEKDILLQELHHRVKNNMQLILSLIWLQNETIDDPQCRDRMLQFYERINAIMTVHDSLFRQDELRGVHMKPYFEALTGNICRGVAMSSIEVDIDICDTLLPLDKATSCGLILNELVANANKHVFSTAGRGRLEIRLSALPQGRFLLSVADSGEDFPGEYLLSSVQGSLGLRLVKTLVTDSLNGSIRVVSRPGTRFEIEFEGAGDV